MHNVIACVEAQAARGKGTLGVHAGYSIKSNLEKAVRGTGDETTLTCVI